MRSQGRPSSTCRSHRASSLSKLADSMSDTTLVHTSTSEACQSRGLGRPST